MIPQWYMINIPSSLSEQVYMDLIIICNGVVLQSWLYNICKYAAVINVEFWDIYLKLIFIDVWLKWGGGVN